MWNERTEMGKVVLVPMVQSVERAFAILKALSVAPAGVSELADLVSLPKSTVARLLSTLEAMGAVDRVDEGTDYQIGQGLVELTGARDASATMVVAVRPYLAHLAEALGEAVGFGVPEGYTIHFLVQVESPQPVQVRDYSGLAVPMHIGPSGYCVMAQWPLEEVQRYLSRPLEAYTAKTVVDPERILARLDETRELGYAWVDEEFAEGLSSVAAPVFDAGGFVIGAINVHGPTYRFPGVLGLEKVGQMVKEAAERFSLRNAGG
jgi:DNA-binding IclR family transcriptional regulator